jgi:tryptophanyl-tRNA synthetase
LTVAFIGLAVGPLLLVGIVLAWQSHITQQQQALRLQREVAQRVAAQVGAFLHEPENQLRLVSQVGGLPKPDRD